MFLCIQIILFCLYRCICNENFLGDACECIKQQTFSQPKNVFGNLIHPCPTPSNENDHQVNQCTQMTQSVGLEVCNKLGFAAFVALEEKYSPGDEISSTLDGKSCAVGSSWTKCDGPRVGWTKIGKMCRCPYINLITCSRSVC